MNPLSTIEDERPLWTGTILRIFNVKRMDIMKYSNDFIDVEKRKLDFYDLMLIDTSIVKDNTFILLNITPDSDNKGKIYGIINRRDSTCWMEARELKAFFGSTEDIYLAETDCGIME